MEGQTHAVMVRSPHPHARIICVNAVLARSMPGVVGVFSGADCRADELGPIPHSPVPSTKYDMKLTAPGGGKIFIGPHQLLPADRARHVGEAVAMVVAQTEVQALDAAEAVEIEYEVLPSINDSEAALATGAQAVWDEVPDNLLVETIFGDARATDSAFANAAHVVKTDFRIGRDIVTLEYGQRSRYTRQRTIHTLRRKRWCRPPETGLASVLGLPRIDCECSYDVGQLRI